jgi:hypothetical protein
MAQRLNFANWRLVDIDNFMKGNSFFAKQVSAQEWQEQVDKVVGPKEQLNKPITSVHEMEKLTQLM